MKTKKIPMKLLKEYFSYNKKGYLCWKKNVRSDLVGKRVGHTEIIKGYRVLFFQYKNYREHRLIYFMHKKAWPPMVDHINRDKSDNRIENLRAATHGQNVQNSCGYAKSGFKGVYFNKRVWEACISLDGKRKFLGSSKDVKKAVRIYQDFVKNSNNPYLFKNFKKKEKVTKNDNRKKRQDGENTNFPG